MAKTISVCLLSGGIDSTVAATTMAQQPNMIVSLLSVFYGQGAESAEREHAARVAEWLRRRYDSVVEYFVLELGGEVRWLKDSLAKTYDTPTIEPKKLQGFVGWRSPKGGWAQAGYPSTRDEAFVLMAAAGLEARLRDAPEATHGQIVLSTTKDDIENFKDIDLAIYEHQINSILARKLMPQMGKPMRVKLPFVELSKFEVIRQGIANGAPLELTWSCYFGSPGAPCQTCDQCEWRRAAFQQLGTSDPALTA